MRHRACHPASLIQASLHDPNLLCVVHSPVTMEMITYVANKTISAIVFEGEAPVVPHTQLGARSNDANLPSPPITPASATCGKSLQRQQARASAVISLEHFVLHLVKSANVQVGTLLSTLIYLERLKAKLPPMTTGEDYTHHRIFLATLIIASKYLNDSSPKNIHWAAHARIFYLDEITHYERELLHLLDFDLAFNELEASTFFAPFMADAREYYFLQRSLEMKTASSTDASVRAAAIDRVTQAGKKRAQAKRAEFSISTSTSSSLSESSCTHSDRPSARFIRAPGLQTQSRISLHPALARALPSTHSEESLDMGALTEDSGLASSSSSECYTSEDEDQFEYDNIVEVSASPAPMSHRRPFVLRPVPAYAYSKRQQESRRRKPSDTSSVKSNSTVTGGAKNSPQQRFISDSHSTQKSSANKRFVAAAYTNSSHCQAKSSAAPASRYTGGGRNILSRIWGAATNTKGGQQQYATDAVDVTEHEVSMTSSAFRRVIRRPSPILRSGYAYADV